MWLAEGDCNTRFFHSTTLKRNRCNKILSIQDLSRERLLEPSKIREVFVQYFRGLSQSTIPPPIPPEFAAQGRILSDSLEGICNIPMVEEIESVIKGMHPISPQDSYLILPNRVMRHHGGCCATDTGNFLGRQTCKGSESYQPSADPKETGVLYPC